ncbi:hypothetical protein TNCT_587441 [Trichonephila clavata]|uniref:Uncharacterized protein n=1 Tax=Trichonephila clavata TaxID=2740835 RepID=A0A8X6HDL4_TRICU|nr:hypothetical protein TNCT_587441 [Trichonephila clavata]
MTHVNLPTCKSAQEEQSIPVQLPLDILKFLLRRRDLQALGPFPCPVEDKYRGYVNLRSQMEASLQQENKFAKWEWLGETAAVWSGHLDDEPRIMGIEYDEL